MSLRVALVYDLKSDYEANGHLHRDDLAELDDEVVIEDLETALASLGHTTFRVGRIQSLVKALAQDEHRQWDLVWNISEGFYGTIREAQVPSLLEAYQIPYTFSDAATLAIAHDKVLTKIVLDHHGVPNAPFTVIAARTPFVPRTLEQWREAFPHTSIFSAETPALFVKPAIVDALNEAVYKLRLRFPDQDLLVETFLSGREFTVSLLGTGDAASVVGSIEHAWAPEAHLDFWTHSIKTGENMEGTVLDKATMRGSEDPVAHAVEALALRTWRALGCRDAGRVDVRCQGSDERAEPFVVEVNALAGLRRDYSWMTTTAENAGLSFETLIERILASAVRRLPASH